MPGEGKEEVCTCSVLVRLLFPLLHQAHLRHIEAVLAGQGAHVVDEVTLADLHEGKGTQLPLLGWEKKGEKFISTQHTHTHD